MAYRDTVGVIFPILAHHLRRIFDDQKRVFVKFIGRELSPGRLHSGSRLFFYQSGSSKEVVGEARIVGIAAGTVEEVLAKHGKDLFLTPTELETYAGNRKAKRMLILILEDAKRYQVPLKLDKGLTMAGQYMTKTMYDDLRARNVARIG